MPDQKAQVSNPGGPNFDKPFENLCLIFHFHFCLHLLFLYMCARRKHLENCGVQHDIEYLRKARFFLLRADLAWPSFVRRMHDTPEHPVDAWCARLKELQGMAETIRRGI